ncbi:NAD(P)/FAD-dependent oxidoreductase [Vreelandella utahensis]|uniref:FAD-dependent oxidoreductase n=2 Tax=Halomonadaceae TaxID=28256 RepID=A0A9X4Y8X7_9GAMM|nr:NAD(P)/FAD-dependent oxidoreductase [Halomonas utahensis]MYL25461.1 FAD-dependent oxidoreductase [Halomonas utahensis]
MDSEQVDAVVIGAGVVGLAVGRALARAGHEVLVLERHALPGEEVSSRNSEVIHAGIYYPPGSLKAELCREGRDRLYAFCERHAVAHRRCGKWLVATGEAEIPALERLRRNAADNDVVLEWLSTREIAREPELHAAAGLASPMSGIVDSHAFMQALLGDMEAHGGWLVRQAPVERIETVQGRHRVQVGGDAPCELSAAIVVNAGGLGAVPVARRWEGMPAEAVPRQWFAKGHYFAYSGRHPFQRLIYPLPAAGGLGVHLTLDMAGQARFGPDAHWVDALEWSVPESLAATFADAVRQWWPGLDPARLTPAYAGIRPRIHGPDDKPADFMIQGPREHGLAGAVNLFGIESPGLTASLALADRVLQQLY